MTQKTEITCDGCGDDLTYKSNAVDYRLVLTYESKTPWYVKEGLQGGAMTDMMIYPPIDRVHHFCDLRCLDLWRARERHVQRAWRSWREKWRRERGTKHDNGFMVYWSVPSESEDFRKARVAEFQAAALRAFPMSRPKRT